MTKPVNPAAMPESLPLQTRMGLITRLTPTSDADADAPAAERRYRVKFSTGAEGKRWGYTPDHGYGRYIEELVVSKAAVDLTRINAGAAVLDSHNSYGLASLLARTENGEIVGDEAFCDIVFPPAGIDAAIDRAAALVDVGTIRFVSAGYTQDVVEIVQSQSGDLPRHRVTRWTPHEISLVCVPFDAGAQVERSHPEEGASLRMFPVSFVQTTPEPEATTHNEALATRRSPQLEDDMSKTNLETGAAAETRTAEPTAPVETRAAASVLTAAMALSLRSQAVSLGLPGADADAIISRAEATPDGIREAILAKAAERSAAQPKQDGRIEIVRDATETRRLALQDAMFARMTRTKPADHAMEYRDHSIAEIAQTVLGETRVLRTFADREDVIRRAFHTTSDFPIIYENVLNKTLASRYAIAAPTYTRIAQRRTFKDFRPHPIVRTGDFPMLQSIGEGGEIKFGTFGEKKESITVLAYAIGLPISREMLVNDDLGAIADMISNQGIMISMFEERTFYAVLALNAGAGPALLEGAANMFGTGAGRANLAGAATAITVAAVSAGRAAMRKQKSLGGQNLNLGPRVLLVGPDKETEAQQLVAPIQAAQVTNYNPFSGALDVVTSAEIAGNAWYLFADPSLLPNFAYGNLEGYEAPRVRMDSPFGTNGTALTVEHDFGVGGIDYRGGYRNAGA